MGEASRRCRSEHTEPALAAAREAPSRVRGFIRFLRAVVPPAQRRSAVVICLTILPVGISYGALSAAAGLAVWQTALLAAFALGGAAELTFVAVIASGGLPIFGVIGGWLLNSRHFAFALNVGQYTPPGWRSFAAAHFVNDETTGFARMVPTDRARWGNFIVIAAGVFLTWVGGALIGQTLGAVVDPDALGLDAAFPVLLTCMVIDDLRRPALGAMALCGALLALLATPMLPLGLGAVSSLAVLVPAAVLLALVRRRRG